MMQRSQHLLCRARGFTLIELLLVLAVMVVMSVLAWPRVENLLARAEHRAAAEQVQSALWQLRLETIQTGCPHWFRYHPGTSEYEIAALPYDEVESIDFMESSMSPQETEDQGLNLEKELLTETGAPDGEGRERQELENGNVFLAPTDMLGVETSESQRLSEGLSVVLGEDIFPEEAASLDSESAVASEETDWSKPILFYPDGRADDARIVVLAPSGHRIEITISEMAGHVQIGPRQRPLRPSTGPWESMPTEDVSSEDLAAESLEIDGGAPVP